MSDRPTVDESFSPSEAEYSAFYKVFGECFSAWTEIEGRLLALYIFLLKSPNYDATAASFYSTVGFRAKLEMVDAVIENSMVVSTEEQKQWKTLYQKTSKRSLSRNQLAHYTIYYGRFTNIGPRRMFIAHPRTPSKGARFYVHELGQLRDSFLNLSQELFHFWNYLLSKKD